MAAPFFDESEEIEMKDNAKFYQVKKTFEGVEYTAQFSGVSTALQAIDRSKIDGVDNNEKFGEYIMKHVIVEPKGLDANDFDTMRDYNEVIGWARDVMYGNFRNTADTGESKEKS